MSENKNIVVNGEHEASSINAEAATSASAVAVAAPQGNKPMSLSEKYLAFGKTTAAVLEQRKKPGQQKRSFGETWEEVAHQPLFKKKVSNREASAPVVAHNGPLSKLELASKQASQQQQQWQGGNNGQAVAAAGAYKNAKQAESAVIGVIELENFSLKSDVQHGALPGGKSRNVPLCRSSEDAGAIFIRMTGGGRISPKGYMFFEAKNDQFSKDGGKLQMSVSNRDDQKAMRSIYGDLLEIADRDASLWFKPNQLAKERYRSIVKPLMEEPRAKDNSDTKPVFNAKGEYDMVNFWEPSIRLNILRDDLNTLDAEGKPVLSVVDDEGVEIQDLEVLNSGLQWDDVTFQITSLWVGFPDVKNPKTKQVIGRMPTIQLSAKVRRLVVAADKNKSHYVFPHLESMHKQIMCEKKHDVPIPISAFKLKNHHLLPMKKDKLKNIAALKHKETGSLIILKLTGGGGLPPFCTSIDQYGKLNITCSVSAEDEVELARIVHDLGDMTMQRRKEFFPYSQKPTKDLRDFVIGFVKIPKQELKEFDENGDGGSSEPPTDGGTGEDNTAVAAAGGGDAPFVPDEAMLPPNSPTATFDAESDVAPEMFPPDYEPESSGSTGSKQHLMSAQINLEQLDDGTACIVDEYNQIIAEPMLQLPGRQWQEIWLCLPSVFMQSKQALFTVSFVKRILYMKLAPFGSVLPAHPPPPYLENPPAYSNVAHEAQKDSNTSSSSSSSSNNNSSSETNNSSNSSNAKDGNLKNEPLSSLPSVHSNTRPTWTPTSLLPPSTQPSSLPPAEAVTLSQVRRKFSKAAQYVPPS